MEQKLNSVTSAETKDDSSTKADVTTSSPNNAKPNVGRSAFSKRLLVSSLITVLILVSQVFYELPKWLVFLLILILVCQPLVIVFTNDHNKYKQNF